MSRKVYLILHDIRSAENVGAIFRTADGVGVDKIYLSGYTPAPLDRFGRPVAKISKAALGAEQEVAWEKVMSPMVLIKELKAAGVMIVALEQAAGAVDYKRVPKRGALALIVGNETMGIDRKILNQADLIAEISMRGKKESLNVSVATGIALARLVDL
jgi:23S rRNA (guanosine2251-2'-O)-methyltransferase